jgi:hypothetical protein
LAHGGNEKMTDATVRQNRMAIKAMPGRCLLLGGQRIAFKNPLFVTLTSTLALSRADIQAVPQQKRFPQNRLVGQDTHLATCLKSKSRGLRVVLMSVSWGGFCDQSCGSLH